MAVALVIQITPQLPPQICGLGDYATCVSAKLAESGALRCALVAAGHKPSTEPLIASNVRNVTGYCDPSQLWRAVDDLRTKLQPAGAVTVVLNYSGYGYDRNGCPEWLVNALSIRPQYVDRVVTFFHELFATGSFWQRSFWYSRRQRRVAASLCKLSDAVLTNREQSAKWLESCNSRTGNDIRCLAVPSNVGELSVNTELGNRGSLAVCFGARRFKASFFSSSSPATIEICCALGIRQIINIGESVDFISPHFRAHHFEIVQTGYLKGCEVSDYMSDARLAFASYFPTSFAKSGVIAALASHGVPIIADDQCNIAADGLVPGEHYLCLLDAVLMTRKGESLRNELDRIGSKLFSWYQSHDIAAHAQLITMAALGQTPS